MDQKIAKTAKIQYSQSISNALMSYQVPIKLISQSGVKTYKTYFTDVMVSELDEARQSNNVRVNKLASGIMKQVSNWKVSSEGQTW